MDKKCLRGKDRKKKRFMCFLFKNQLDFVDIRTNTKKTLAVHYYSLCYKNRNDSILFYNILTADIREVIGTDRAAESESESESENLTSSEVNAVLF